MNRKSIYMRILPILLSATIFTACSSTSKSQANPGAQTEANAAAKVKSSPVTSATITYDKEDYYSDWKNENPNYVTLSGSSASIKGSGAVVKDGKITISSAGVYVLSGKMDNGQIIVDVRDKGTVKVVLNGAEINCADNAPIYVKNAGKTIVSLQEGTQNVITDGKKYELTNASTDEPSAAIFSKSNLILNGTGKLTVHANYKDGIASKDDLKVTGGNITVNAADDGLIGKDELLVKDGNITIEATGDAIKSTNDTEPTKGFIALEGGNFDIKAGADGIQAETSALISGGKFTIITGGGNAQAPVKTENNGPGFMGKPSDTNTAKTTEAKTPSAKAIKASSDITICGGTLSIDSYDDAINSKNSVNIAGGDITITAGDDGIHGDTALTIKDGKVDITKSYEGIESGLITIDGGETHVTSSDDGVNVSGGNDGSSVNGRPGQNNFNASSDNKLIINGGYISVDSEGDGIDSNGAVTMTGGTAVVSGPTVNNNGALDYDTGFEMTGGLLIAAGSSGMAQAPSEESKQYSVAMYYSKIQQPGILASLKDSKGSIIATFAPKKDYQSIVISSPELKKGSQYTLYSGGTSTGTLSDGLYTKGEYQSGTKVVSFTISNSVTWLDESGVTTKKSSNPGGPGGQRPGRGN